MSGETQSEETASPEAATFPATEATTPDSTPSADGEESFAELFESSVRLIKSGQVVKGTVLRIDPEFVLVDVG